LGTRETNIDKLVNRDLDLYTYRDISYTDNKVIRRLTISYIMILVRGLVA